MAEDRQTWGSRANFIFAAIGSAVGLGNAWRFAGQVFQNGGGAFMIPYIVALVVFGIPILMMELAIGKKYKLGAPSAFAKMNPKFEWIGWAGIIISFVIAVYYSVLIAWVVDYIGASFTMAWGADPAAYFKGEILHASEGPGQTGGFSVPVLLGLIFTWVFTVLAMRKGVEVMARMVKWIVILPTVILIVMCFPGVSMPGASEGIAYYFTPDWQALLNPNVWAAAFGQVAYSLSILFALMITYGSFLQDDADIPKDSFIIGFTVMGISMVAGFVVFSSLGHLSLESSVPITQMDYQGVMLAFVTYPQALSIFPGGHTVGVIFSVLFFSMLFMMAIDSLFSIVQAVSTAISDKFKLDPTKCLYGTIIVCFACSLLYATGAGMYWLDIIDHFVNEGTLLFMGLFETVAVCWIFGINKIRDFINRTSDIKLGAFWDFVLKYACPMIFILLSVNFLYTNITEPYGGYERQFIAVGGWALVIVTFAAAIILPHVTKKETRNKTITRN